MIARIWAGSVMTAMTDILVPHRGQVMTCSSWTLASSLAQAFLRESASTSRSFAASGSTGVADVVRPYQLAGARERRAG